ncbi:3-hydroxyacyl-CoA dehydrogenase family protein [Arthrobacter sp. A2-55]|uniref:3-hydroxyacyl-CoA dehydrogenase family protein n=1 Tax=Arthrobacter sp. A2-55 TaxID=2897337 RepID=UPI0021CD631A|nr:3-hydroxyacyl-CoA dehydrogenase family protein [Arthrobacter sp. A2-55]MCU6481160.1 3-hydroxyacyl-CoA dehydrogenase family protein [Arthrobacter sp. A2-55]
MHINNILVVGSGAMGSQIGLVASLAGYATTIHDIAAEPLAAAREQIASRLDSSVAKGRLSRPDADAALARLSFTTSLEEGAAGADLVIEAATERLDVKRAIFAALDAAAQPHAILATNSSTLGSSKVAGSTSRPGKVCNMHFFNPALVMKCVEVVRHPGTSQETLDTVMELARRLGKAPVLINHEIPGFVANRLMGAIRDEALRLYAEGIATFEDIDTAAKTALGHPMGPFELMDLVGLDVSYLIRQATFAETGDPADLPHPALTEMYERGDYGRKTGKGWYRYGEAATAVK